MNETLKANIVAAWDQLAAAKRRFAEATARHLQPQQAIEDYRKAHAAEHSRQMAEQQDARLRWEAEGVARANAKRQREAQYVEEQRKAKHEYDRAESALAAAERASVRAERELAEDSESERLKKERAAAKAQREADQAIWDEGKRQQKQTEAETKARYQ